MARTYETVLSLFAKDNTARAFQSLNRRLKKLSAGIASAATRFANIGTAAVLAAGAATAAFVSMRMSAIDNLAKTADRIGTTTESLAALQHAGELTGVSTNTMNMALQRMTRRVAEAAQGTGEAKNALKELGIDAEALKNLPLDQQMEMVADSMAGVESQADRVRLAMKLFDSEGVALVNTLGQGGDALRAMMSEADQLGISLSRLDAAKIEQANDAASRMTGVFTGIGNQLAVSFSPMIEAASNWITHLALTTEGFADIGAKAAGFVARAFHALGDVMRGLNVIVLSIRLGFVNLAESTSSVMHDLSTVLQTVILSIRLGFVNIAESASVTMHDLSVRFETAILSIRLGFVNLAAAISGVMQGVGQSVVEIINSTIIKWNTFSRTIIDGYNDLARRVPFLDMTTDWSPTVGKVQVGSEFFSSQEAIFKSMAKKIRGQLSETLNSESSQQPIFAQMGQNIRDELTQTLNADSFHQPIFAAMAENIKQQLGETLDTDSGQAFEDALGNFVDRFQSPDAPGQVIPPEIDEGMTAIEDKAKAAADNVRSDIADSLIAGVTDGKDAMISSFANTLQQMSMELLKSKLMSGLEKIFGGSGDADGGFFANLGAMFSARANGGPVTGGVPYLVGERGPEIMVPGRNGTIIPNQRMAAGGMNYAPVVNISGGATAEDRAFFTAQLRNQRAEIADLMARGRF